MLDTVLDTELIHERVARELMNRIQRLRKKAGLVPTDEVGYYYQITKDEGQEFKTALASQEEFLKKSLKQAVIEVDSVPEGKIVAQEDQEISEAMFVLYLK